MRERIRRWLCVPDKPILFALTCNHCQHPQHIDGYDLRVEVTDYATEQVLAARCPNCTKTIAMEVTVDMADAALQAGAKHTHVVAPRPICERDIRKSMRSVDAEYEALCEG